VIATVRDALLTALALCALAVHFAIFELIYRLTLVLRPARYRDVVLVCAHGVLGILRLFYRLRIEVGPLPPALHDGPFICIANHQSPVDMPVIMTALGRRMPRFVARAGLDRGFPGVSHFLRNGGGVVLRRDRDWNLRAIRGLAADAAQQASGVLIFPEGCKDGRTYGRLAPFRRPGALALLAGAPTAPVVPTILSGGSDFYAKGKRPPRYGCTIHIEFATPILRAGVDDAEILAAAERQVRARLGGGPEEHVGAPVVAFAGE
jgi:1-acyl-sn-glycerol-3-phosphate acyltransferase